jgi:hypothetical protein
MKANMQAKEDAIRQHHAIAAYQLRGMQRAALLDPLRFLQRDAADDQEDQSDHSLCGIDRPPVTHGHYPATQHRRDHRCNAQYSGDL